MIGLLWVLIGLNVAALITGVIVFQRIWNARKEDMKYVILDREQAAADRAQATLDREVATATRADLMKILELIKGWTVVSADTNKKVGDSMDKQNTEVKQKIEEVGSKVDNIPPKVVEELNKPH